jgi:uncharacterized membrane protein
MSEDTTELPPGAGATTGTSTSNQSGGFIGSGHTAPNQSHSSAGNARFESTYATGSVHRDEHESGYRSHGRAVVVSERTRSRPSTATIVGAAVAGAIAGGAIPFMLSGRSSSTFKRSSANRSETTTVEESVVINRPARQLYDFWRDFENLPQFMDNIRSVEKLDQKRSHWVIKAPAGTSVEFDSRVTEDVPGRLIAWASEEGASVPNRGRVEFIEGSSPGTTTVRTTISYDPPAGAAGRLIAKLFQREPGTQAKEDLTRFKELMEGRSNG